MSRKQLNARVTTRASGDEEMSVLMGRATGLSGGNTYEAPIMGTSVAGVSPVAADSMVIPFNYKISRLFVHLPTAPGAGNASSVVLKVNGGNTALSVTLTDTTQDDSNTATIITGSAGDTVRVVIGMSASAVNTISNWAFQLDKTA